MLRRMRVIPWRNEESDAPMATLVIEWLKNDRVERDERHQMNVHELVNLTKSANEAVLELLR